MTEAQIKKNVDDVFKETDLLSIPVEIVAMVSFYGFSVYGLDMDDDISGMIIVNDKPIKSYGTNKLIIVNSNHSSTRKRFTIAHELGHYILQGRPQKCYSHRESSGVYNPEERDANSFASALLMPEEDVRRFVKSISQKPPLPLDLTLIFNVAKRYNVSESSAEVRLKKLGII